MQKWAEKALKGIWGFIKAVIYGLFVPGITALIGRLAWLRGIPTDQFILYVLAALGLSLLALNQFLVLKKKVRRSPGKWPDKRVERTIREWVDIPGFTYEKMPPQAGVLFNVVIKDKSGRYIHINKTIDEPAFIVLVARVKIEPPGPALEKKEWEILASRVSVEMARLGIEYVFDGEENILEFIRLMDRVILDDAFNSLLFRKRILFVIRAVVLIAAITKQWAVGEELAAPTALMPESPTIPTRDL
jgi:hypothetical protein